MSPSPATKGTGRAEGFEAAFRGYDSELRGFLARRLRRSAVSPDDVRQEVYLRILRFKCVDLVREPRAYLYKVARHVLYDFHHREQRDVALKGRCRGSTPDRSLLVDGDDTAVRIDNRRCLETMLNQLPPQFSAVLTLRLGRDMSHQEVARELDMSVHTVKKYVHLALARLRLMHAEQ